MPLSARLRALSSARPFRTILLSLGTAFAAIVMFACRDLTTPARPTIEPSTVSTAVALGAPGGRIVVTPDSMRNWVFYDDQRDAPCRDATACRLVSGPIGMPAGTGSAELAVPKTPDGKALLLADYKGVRFADITALRYSTYRQSADPSNNLAIALQIRVDYDLADGATGEQGRMIFEPFQGAAGTVVQGAWQSWDARAGKWWGTKASVMRGNIEVENPCVAQTPCTWPQLLARFPNIGVHATFGALLLKAGTRTSGFRGNVDALEVGVGGTTTLYDFEAVAPPIVQTYHLRASIGDGVLSTSVLLADSAYAAGSRVPFTLSSRTGRATPVVILDDSLAETSGTILMDRDHTMEVTSDTLYSYATLTPLERGIADREQTLLTSANKADAELALIRFYLAQLSAGVDADVVMHASEVARAVTFDPVRDSVALRQVSDALAFTDFYIDDYGSDGYSTYWSTGRYWAVDDRLPQPGAFTSRGSSAITTLKTSPADDRPLAEAMEGMRSPVMYVGTPRARMPSTATGVRASTGTTGNFDDPKEYTLILFTNGIWNDHPDADVSIAKLREALHSVPRLGNGRTSTLLHYNATRSEEMKQYDAAHRCEVGSLGYLQLYGWNGALSQYMACKSIRRGVALARVDLVESARLRISAQLHAPASNADVDSLAKRIRGMRAKNYHVLLVGHSEGTLIDALALQQLPAREGHPLQVADRCIAVVALSSAASRSSYGLDEYHLTGILAKHDILGLLGIANPAEWQQLQTDTTAMVDVLLATQPPALALPLKLYFGLKLHQAFTYLKEPGAAIVRSQVTQLHRECQAGSATFSLSPTTVAVGTTISVAQTVINQNARPLIGRRINLSYDPWLLQRVDSTTLRAITPRDSSQRITTSINSYFELAERITVPPVAIPLTVTRKDSSHWTAVGGTNGGNASGIGNESDAPGPAPTQMWSGDVSSCGQIVRVAGATTSWIDYQLVCSREYVLNYTNRDSLSSGRAITRTYEKFNFPVDESVCVMYVSCATSVWVVWLDAQGQIIGRSPTVILPEGSARSRVSSQPAPVMTRVTGGPSGRSTPTGTTIGQSTRQP